MIALSLRWLVLLAVGWLSFGLGNQSKPLNAVRKASSPAFEDRPSDGGGEAQEAAGSSAAFSVNSGFTVSTGPESRSENGGGFRTLDEAFHAARHAIQPVLHGDQLIEENHGVQYFAHHEGQSMIARFSRESVRIQSSAADSNWRIEIRRPGEVAGIHAEGSKVEYRHADGVCEWYQNNTDGLQHGFVVPDRMNGDDDGLLRMRMAVDGLTVSRDPGSDGDLVFNNGEGRALAAYRGLRAWDAAGRDLEAEMHPNSEGFEIAVNDRDAIYPVHIDPYFLNLEQSTMTEMAGTGRYNDRFGSATAIDGDTAVVTARNAASLSGGSGRAYVFVRSGNLWSLQAEIWAADGRNADEFGHSADLDGDTLAVGAWNTDVGSASGNEGAVYVFRRNNSVWSQQAKLTAPTPVNEGHFGNSLSLQGDELAVGATSGGACVFQRTGDTWQLQSQPSFSALWYGFGTSVALSGDNLLIGAPREAMGITSQVGAAYLFARSGTGWIQQQRIASPVTASGDNFGQVVAMDGNVAVVGAPNADKGAVVDCGAFSIYRRNGEGVWVSEYFYQPGGSNLFRGGSLAVSGESVVVGGLLSTNGSTIYQPSGDSWTSRYFFNNSPAAIDGPTLLIGSSGEPGDGSSAASAFGAAFIYQFNGTSWPLQQRLAMGNSMEGTGLGNSLVMQGNTVLIGASNEPAAAGVGVGSVYVFVKSGGLWTPAARLVSDTPAALRYFGSRLALDGDTAAVSCVGDSHVSASGTVTSNVGSVSVFVRNGTTWSLQKKLYAADFAGSDNFGSGLALQGNQLLAGSPFDSDGSGSGQSQLGSVYWFERNGTAWTQRSKFRSQNTRDNQRFGCSIAIDNGTAVIGAYSLVSNNYYAGQAFIFTFNGASWSRQAAIEPPVAASYMLFGNDVAISGDTVLIGAPGWDLPSVSDPFGSQGGVGRAHVFTRSGIAWSHQAVLEPLDGNQQTAFGGSMEIEGNIATIKAGSTVELFARNGTVWDRQGVYQSTISPGTGGFGSGMAIDGNLLAVGSPSMGRTLDSIQRSYGSLGSVEFFRISTAPAISVKDHTGRGLADELGEYDYGIRTSGSAVSRTFTITNAGGEPLGGLSPAIGGEGAAMFAISGWSGETLELEAGRSFEVIYQPSAAGMHRAVLRISSGNPADGDFEIALVGEGVTARGAFNNWAAGLSDASPGATPFQDGVPNLLKYAFNMNPNAPDRRILGSGNAGLPCGAPDKLGDDSPVFVFEYLRRKGSGLVYQPLCSTSLKNDSYGPLEAPTLIQSVDENWERVSHRVPLESSGGCFFKVEVSIP